MIPSDSYLFRWPVSDFIDCSNLFIRGSCESVTICYGPVFDAAADSVDKLTPSSLTRMNCYPFAKDHGLMREMCPETNGWFFEWKIPLKWMTSPISGNFHVFLAMVGLVLRCYNYPNHPHSSPVL